MFRCKEYIKPVYLQENFHSAHLNGANNAVRGSVLLGRAAKNALFDRRLLQLGGGRESREMSRPTINLFYDLK